MQFTKFSSCRLLIILLCFLGVNDAVPFRSYSADEVRSTTSSQSITEIDETNETNRANSSMKNDNDSEIYSKDIGSDKAKQKGPEKCVNELRRQNQTHTRSIPSNTSFGRQFNPAEDFKIAGEAEAKKTSTVHVGEDIALCWIETITVKEDPKFDPPKRLVIREFTISFENSASIPDNYLDCNTIEGEIALGDEDNVRKSAIDEVIDDNTMRSREINFTHVSNTGDIIIRQHKRVKCGVGAVMTKDIFEWPDGTDNPKKRVEIKVGPSLRDLRESENKPSECTAKKIPKKPQSNHSQSSSHDCISNQDCDPSSSCENGVCRRTATITPCKDNDCSSTSLSEEIVPTTYSPDSNEVLSTGVTERTTTMEPTRKKLTSPLLHKPERATDDVCLENDTDCISSKTTTVQPESVSKKLGGLELADKRTDKTATTTIEPTRKKLPSPLVHKPEEAKDDTCLENDTDCISSKTTTDQPESISKKLAGPESLEKGTDKTTTSSVHGANVTTTESSEHLLDTRSSTEENLGCDVESEECLGSTRSYSDAVEDAFGKTGSTPLSKHLNNEFSAEQSREIDISDGVTQIPKTIRDPVATETAITCDGSDVGCSTVTPEGNNILVEVPKRNENNYSPFQTTGPLNINKEGLQPPKSDSNETEISSMCAESESCESPVEVTSNSESKRSEMLTILTTSQKPEMVTKLLHPQVNGIPNTSDLETRIPKPSTKPNEIVTLSDESPGDAEISSVYRKTTVVPSSDLTDIKKMSSAMGETTFPPQSCESLENCRSNGTFSSDETKQTITTNDAESNKATSICDDNTESCESPLSSSNVPDNCQDGTSGSCSSETSDAEITTTQSTVNETELLSRINDTASNVEGTRRSIVPTTPVSIPIKGRHRLALRIKVLLEHIDENKEKEQLVQVERHLLLNERPSEHGNHSLMLQLQSLNNSMNFETLKAIFNCSALNNLSKDVIDLDKLSKDVINLKESGQKANGNVSHLDERAEVPSVEDSASLDDDDEEYNSNDGPDVKLSERKKREISILLNGTTEILSVTDQSTDIENVTDISTEIGNITDRSTEVGSITDRSTEVENMTDPTTEKAILERFPGVEEDLKNGMDHVLSRISKELDDTASDAVNTTGGLLSSSKILRILSDPSDSRVHSRSPNRTLRVKRLVTVQQMENPVNGEEIERWSNERLVSAADGGQIRSLTEFRILRDRSADYRRDYSGL